jgi:hypothetical protein
MRTFSEYDRHMDKHNEGICSICGCTTARWKLVCNACRDKAIQEFIKKVKPKAQEEEK